MAEGVPKNQENTSYKKCRHCGSRIPTGVDVCFQCHHSQSWWHWLMYAPIAISFVMLLIAITQTSIGYNQNREARRKRIAAEEALGKAKEVENIAKRLEEVERIRELGNLAIVNFSRYHLEKLEEIQEGNESISIRRNATSEILRVKAFYITASRLPKQYLEYSEPNKEPKTLNKLSTDTLIELLVKDGDWRLRAQSAKLLRDRKEIGVPAALAYSILLDGNLEVIQKSVMALDNVSDFDSQDIFSLRAIKPWCREYIKAKPDNALRKRELTAIDYFILAKINNLYGEQSQAMENLQKSVALKSDFGDAYNMLAWIYATSRNDDMRDGEKAISYANKAITIDEKNFNFIDTLAAAFAEKGNFREAIRYQKQAISLLGDSLLEEEKLKYKQRLELYEKGQAYRE